MPLYMDVHALSESVAMDDVAQAHAADLRAQAPHDVQFLRYWVAKEAVLKAQGVGLAFPLDAFAIVFARDGATARVTSTDPRRLSPAWTVRMLSVGAGWPAAVAAAGDDWTLVPCLVGSAA